MWLTAATHAATIDHITTATVAPGQFCHTGYVLDRFCIERGTLLDNSQLRSLQHPDEHSFHCLLDVSSCRNSVYELLSDSEPSVIVEPSPSPSPEPSPTPNDGDFVRLGSLDSAGQAQAVDAARAEGRCGTCLGGYSGAALGLRWVVAEGSTEVLAGVGPAWALEALKQQLGDGQVLFDAIPADGLTTDTVVRAQGGEHDGRYFSPTGRLDKGFRATVVGVLGTEFGSAGRPPVIDTSAGGVWSASTHVCPQLAGASSTASPSASPSAATPTLTAVPSTAPTSAPSLSCTAIRSEYEGASCCAHSPDMQVGAITCAGLKSMYRQLGCPCPGPR